MCIALGYLHVNTGKLSRAVELFTELIKKNPRVIAAYLGMYSAFFRFQCKVMDMFLYLIDLFREG